MVVWFLFFFVKFKAQKEITGEIKIQNSTIPLELKIRIRSMDESKKVNFYFKTCDFNADSISNENR